MAEKRQRKRKTPTARVKSPARPKARAKVVSRPRIDPPAYVMFEVTRGCPLGCGDCRHSALPPGSPGDLSTEEAARVVLSVAKAYETTLVFTGPEPLAREDIFDLAEYAKRLGLRVKMCTNAWEYDANKARRMVEVGVKEVEVSLDGSSGRFHDAFRQTQGAFTGAIKGIDLLRLSGLKFSTSCTITNRNAQDLPRILGLSRKLGAQQLTVFFNVPTGRGRAVAADEMDGATYIEWLNWIFDQQFFHRMPVQVVCSPQFERIYRERASELPDKKNPFTPGREHLAGRYGCLAAKEFAFIAHDGAVHPCPYLLEPAGNVLTEPFDQIWEKAPVMAALRQTTHLGGKCGECKFQDFCSGCRALARAHAGDYMAEDPLCEYQPGR